VKARTATITGWVLAAIAAIVGVLTIVVWATGSSSFPWTLAILLGGLPLTFSLIGALIIWKRPDNRLGWLFAVGGAATVVTTFGQTYADRALASDPGSSAGRAAAWIVDLSDPLSLGLMTIFLFLLFPAGRLESRSARWVAIVAIVGIGLAMVGALVEPSLQSYGDSEAPFAPAIPASISETLLGLGFSLMVLALLASVVLLVRKLRRAAGRERDQLRLLVWAAVLATVLLLPALLLPDDAPDSLRNVLYLFGGLGFLLIPISVGVAILRHGLLDIDLVIKRALVIALLGGFITAVYVGLVVGIGAVVGSGGNTVLSAIAAAVVAIAFQPVRRWAQRLADRLVYGERATPYEVMHEFSERVAGSYGTEDVLPRMAAILGQGTGAERAQVWLRIGSELRPMAAWPEEARRSGSIRISGSELPEMADVSHAVPVRDRDELLGALSVTKAVSDRVTPTEERLVGDLALQAGLVLRNVRLLEDLRASRGRLVAAQDAERRRLERNIHDGAQQQLVALAVKAKLVDAMVERDVEKAREILGQIQAETHEALESLRDLARGIYPPLLADKGLPAALEAQARRAPMPVAIAADGVERYPQEVEATTYFCVLEALQNASKYAEASSVTITLRASDAGLTFEVADDGRGFDPASTPWGSGLQNITDRLEAIGGTLEIRSEAGAGTRLVGLLPISS
jgi:signal transduction histidine kinase